MARAPQHYLPVLLASCCMAPQHGLKVHNANADFEEMADACTTCLPCDALPAMLERNLAAGCFDDLLRRGGVVIHCAGLGSQVR